MAVTERLAFLLTMDGASQVGRDLESLSSRSGRSLGQVGDRMQQVGGTLTRTLTPAMAGLGAVSYAAFNQFDAGADALRAAGAVGDEFTDSMKDLGDEVPASFEQIGQTMGEVYQRTKLTGEPLEDLTQQVLELGELGQTVNVEQLTASLSKAGVEAEDMADALDVMYRVSQVTGTSVDRLSQLQEQFGASLDLAGLSMEDQLLLLGQMEAAGVNTSQVMAGMTRGLRDLAASGQDPAEALADLFEQMQNAGSEAEAVSVANEVFGRSAVEVAAAVRSGSMDLEAMQAQLAGNTDSIHEAATGTRDWAETLAMANNKLIGVAGPLGQYGMALSAVGAVAGPVVSGLGKVGSAISNAGGVSQIAQRGATSFADSLGSIGTAAAITAPAIGALALAYANAQEEAAQHERVVGALSDRLLELDDAGQVAEEMVTELVKGNEFLSSAMNDAGVTISDVASALDDGGGSWDQMSERLLDASGNSTGMALALDMIEDSFTDAAGQADEAATAIERSGDAAGAAVSPTQDLVSQMFDAARAADEEFDAVSSLNQAVNDLIGVHVSAVDAVFAVEDGYISLTAKLGENWGAWQANTEAGRENLSAVNDQVSSVLDLASARAEETGRTEDAVAVIREHRERLLGTLEAFGMTREEAGAYLDRLGLIPDNITTRVFADTAQAQAQLVLFRGWAEGIFGGLSNVFGGMLGAQTTMSGAVPGRSAPQGRSAPRGRSRDEVVLSVDGYPVTGVVSRRQRMVAKERV